MRCPSLGTEGELAARRGCDLFCATSSPCRWECSCCRAFRCCLLLQAPANKSIFIARNTNLDPQSVSTLAVRVVRPLRGGLNQHCLALHGGPLLFPTFRRASSVPCQRISDTAVPYTLVGSSDRTLSNLDEIRPSLKTISFHRSCGGCLLHTQAVLHGSRRTNRGVRLVLPGQFR